MEVPLARFDVLLRDLVTFGLAVQTDDGSWHFAPGVDDRLTEIAASQRPADRPVLRFGTSCAGCHALRVTRLHEGRHLCEDCIRRGSAPVEDAGLDPEDPEDLEYAPRSEPGFPGDLDLRDRRLVAHYRGPAAADGPG